MSEQLPICVACGTQYDLVNAGNPERCKICDDPRQFVPHQGQQWTTLSRVRKEHKNKWEQDSQNENIWSFHTMPKFGIGQRAILIETSHGNVLWDLVSLLDSSTIDFITKKGGLSAIVVSHPHFYTTYPEWAAAFNCPVWVADDDEKWLCRDSPGCLQFIKGPVGTATQILPGVTAIKTGGHFDGSLVLHWDKAMFVADTLMTVPSAYTPHPRPPGQTSYSFMWSIPNMIPLHPDTIYDMWKALRPYSFETTYGGFLDMTVRDKGLKRRVLDSMKIQVKAVGWGDHPIFKESA